LGTNGVSLVELTAAYAAIAAGRFPIRPHGLPERASWFGGGSSADALDRDRAFPMLRDVLYAVVNRGTGRAAALSIPTFGKTGTTSDYRDAWFVGFAGDLVVGIWVGNDDNRPLPGTTGGGLPARIWRNFMADALGIRPARRPAPTPLSQTDRAPAETTNMSNGLAPPVPQSGEMPPPGQPQTPELVLPPVTLPTEQLPPPPRPEQ
jgi:penicillin-binding protein 1A